MSFNLETKWQNQIDKKIVANRYDESVEYMALGEFTSWKIDEVKSPENDFSVVSEYMYCPRLELTDGGTLVIDIEEVVEISEYVELPNLFFEAFQEFKQQKQEEVKNLKVRKVKTFKDI